jgi:hypothetical protein
VAGGHIDSSNIDTAGNVLLSGFTNNITLSIAYVNKYSANGLLTWSHQLGGGRVFSVTSDSGNNVYATGQSGNISFGDFVQKYDPAGNLLWSKQISTDPNTEPDRVAVDAAKNVYIAGNTVANLFGTVSPGDVLETFVAKYDSTGNLLWGRQFGLNAYNGIGQLAVDSAGNLAVLGWYADASASPKDFLEEFDSSGNLINSFTDPNGSFFAQTFDSANNLLLLGDANEALLATISGSFLAKFAPIPEPSTAVLALIAASSLIFHFRRQPSFRLSG